MADNGNLGFGKFVPGFDFLQNIAKGTSQSLPQMPNLSNWIAPTLNVEELDKRIGELKAVHFWLDQNSKALAATIQALEVQKMTLATLKGMNFKMEDLGNAFKLNADTMLGGMQKMTETAADAAKVMSEAATGAGEKNRAARKKTQGNDAADGKRDAKTDTSANSSADSSADTRTEGKAHTKAAAANGIVDPLQWWGALTQQFQQIATNAMKDAATNPAMDAARNMAAGVTQGAAKSAGGSAKKAAGKRTARKKAT